MLLSFLSHSLCAWFALVLPSYATYKALTPSSSPDALRALSMYWAVLAVFLACEQSFGFVLAWLPFYWELRTIFLLYIALPQTQGSTYVYKSLLEPWCSQNEADIDSALVSAQSNVIAFCRTRIAALVDLVSSSLSKSAHGGDTGKPINQLSGLWAAYGPTLLAAFPSKDEGDVHEAK